MTRPRGGRCPLACPACDTRASAAERTSATIVRLRGTYYAVRAPHPGAIRASGDGRRAYRMEGITRPRRWSGRGNGRVERPKSDCAPAQETVKERVVDAF